ncbi:uncharacterized protein LOC114739888 [Neltuma alba]|uniref:uncharacterized protein LOC114711936 n=1 Tax=Neltuma alba TaxID=207710 RepID=UPI0010A33B15|nr:uncharacterized protein LOC114711936 [Prosopis alba]XP_028783824.1 uncharacterized protein LOC114739888 [Prosopis alba]
MALDHHKDSHLNTGDAWRWYPRRGVPLLRRRKVQMVRLGGKKPGRRRVLFVLRMLKKIRLRWLKLQYRRMLRNLKEYYRNLVKDMVEAGATIEAFQQRLFLESTFAVPAGVTFSVYPHSFGSDRPRTIFIL